ncbi:hypothetical protein LguiA_021091 [Lonicera macranthoides]
MENYIHKLPAMDLMRSEKMTYVQLIIPVESAHRAVSYLGELGFLQFRDLNADKSPFQRTFVNQVKRYAEMLRKLRFFKDQMHKADIPSSARPSMEPDIELEELEMHLAEHERDITEMNANNEKLQQRYNELLELKMVLQKAGGFLLSSKSRTVADERELDENVYSTDNYADSASLLEKAMEPGPSNQSGLRFISGIICKSKVLMFERMLFRATRGNLLFNQAPADDLIMDPVSTEMVEKTVFLVFFSGEQAKTKILKICEAFNASCYPVPEEIVKQRQMTAEVQREKAVFDTLNMLNFDVTKKCLVGEGWCPVFAKMQIQEALQRATIESISQIGIIFHVMDAVESPPTYFRTNHFTNAFQEIVDAYGLELTAQFVDSVARYEEANPAVYTVITFPFLFAVMFGDWGHGICLLLGAMILIARESKLSSQKLGSFMEMLFGGRYVLLLMSLFSIYCGLIYNEFFSVPYHIFGGSAYKCRDAKCRCQVHYVGKISSIRSAYQPGIVGLIKYRDPYPFGVDPSWRGSRTELPFLNSLKMKMSILLGVAQMNLGIILSYFNAHFFGSTLDIRYQFVPQVIFLNSLFGYLSLLILIKWCTGSQADLYHVMIYMFLSPFDDLGENQLFWGQRVLQACVILLLSALIAVPWMLFPKPFILKKLQSERFQGRTYGILGTTDMGHDMGPDSARQNHEEEFNFSEVFVHQMIHSIEFVLGAVSNTASYLRLWALSLAHSELSTVFYEKVLLLAWGYDNVIIRVIGIAVFAFATAFILLMMETLSAFLHALRLHWVEFQNKFYQGDGYKFRPFSFSALTGDED